MRQIYFDKNDNNKLDCSSFITLRMGIEKYDLGSEFIVKVGSSFKSKTAKIEEVKEIGLDQVTTFISYLDSDCSPEELKKKIKERYKLFSYDWKTTKIKLIRMRYTQNPALTQIEML